MIKEHFTPKYLPKWTKGFCDGAFVEWDGKGWRVRAYEGTIWVDGEEICEDKNGRPYIAKYRKVK